MDKASDLPKIVGSSPTGGVMINTSFFRLSNFYRASNLSTLHIKICPPRTQQHLKAPPNCLKLSKFHAKKISKTDLLQATSDCKRPGHQGAAKHGDNTPRHKTNARPAKQNVEKQTSRQKKHLTVSNLVISEHLTTRDQEIDLFSDKTKHEG